MFDFTDRVTMITGATGNLGQAVAQAFAAANATVVLIARSEASIRQALPALAASPNALIAPADLTNPESVQSAVAAALHAFGRIDVLANTVGGYKAGEPVHTTPIETWDFMFDLNVRTAFLVSQAVIPAMLAQGHGAIIHTASRAGLSGGKNAAAYSAAKSAVIRLTESLAAELKHNGINVNCVLPGVIDTPENRAAMPTARHEHWVSADAIAQVILFLASDAARAIHGAAVPVYGLS
ncbi:MAG TPA: SDR family NAD(P)-dependent oxidoreductase [Anaerolineae bacterium]|nr:SDR family NAD(P)-dependent oxidoreductase [Anaerolineae bacterium]HQI83465.1 SDR family NAD(P)-dependent oxidoreductase [Anaerolineae bacterium]